MRLALDGLWISDLFGFAPPSPELRVKMLDAFPRRQLEMDMATIRNAHWE
ncbi:MAG: hypothetical protein AB9907_18805 [Flexilinea sp.]